MYRSGRMSGAFDERLHDLIVGDCRSPAAVTGAFTSFSAALTARQSRPWSFATIMVPMPHFSPCRPFPGEITSRAWLKRCSEPLQGLLRPSDSRGHARAYQRLDEVADRGPVRLSHPLRVVDDEPPAHQGQVRRVLPVVLSRRIVPELPVP